MPQKALEVGDRDKTEFKQQQNHIVTGTAKKKRTVQV
jgi:hypothetical protein